MTLEAEAGSEAAIGSETSCESTPVRVPALVGSTADKTQLQRPRHGLARRAAAAACGGSVGRPPCPPRHPRIARLDLASHLLIAHLGHFLPAFSSPSYPNLTRARQHFSLCTCSATTSATRRPLEDPRPACTPRSLAARGTTNPVTKRLHFFLHSLSATLPQPLCTLTPH